MGLLAYVVVSAVGGAATILCPPLIAPVANLIGITAVGIGPGTLAAGAHAYVGNLAAGSVLSVLQAAAMAPVLP